VIVFEFIDEFRAAPDLGSKSHELSRLVLNRLCLDRTIINFIWSRSDPEWDYFAQKLLSFFL